jgi:hypothetical protein
MIFKGWDPWDKSAYDSVAYLNVPAVSDNFIGFTAVWEEIPEIKTFTVKFFEKDGTTQIGADQVVKEGEDAVPPLAPEVNGFYFIGWDKSYTTITADVSIIAVYGQNKFWTVTYYDADGTTKLGEETVADGMSAKGTPVTKEGNTFLGWFDSNDQPADFSKISADMSVKAEWEKEIHYFKVTLVAEHGKITVKETGINLAKVEENTLLHLTATPDEGYLFKEWQNYDPEKGLTVTADVTVTAVFEEESQGLESIHGHGPAVSIQKVLIDGQLYLMYEGRMYDVRGQKVK